MSERYLTNFESVYIRFPFSFQALWLRGKCTHALYFPSLFQSHIFLSHFSTHFPNSLSLFILFPHSTFAMVPQQPTREIDSFFYPLFISSWEEWEFPPSPPYHPFHFILAVPFQSSLSQAHYPLANGDFCRLLSERVDSKSYEINSLGARRSSTLWSTASFVTKKKDEYVVLVRLATVYILCCWW